jgi:hypothetical protein
MKIKIGKKTLKQTTDGITVDDIQFIDVNTNEVYDFDGYLELIKNENK